MAYCTIAEVKDKTVANAVTQATWLDASITERINEGSAYIESVLCGLGFTVAQLTSAPLVKYMNILYARYAILRDIYINVVPSQSGAEPYSRWLDAVNKMLEDLRTLKTRLVDGDGEVIEPENPNVSLTPAITTEETARIITLDDESTWSISASNYSEAVVGVKSDEE